MFRTFARASQEASGIDGVMRQRNNPRIRLSTAAVRCRRTFTYHADGQLATASYSGDGRALSPRAPQSETFLWDGLALIQRGDEQFINEPHVGGGNPVAFSKGISYFNDALGTTVGSKSNGKYSAAALTAFGENYLTTQLSLPASPKHLGISIDYDTDVINAGLGALIIEGCTHHWEAKFEKE